MRIEVKLTRYLSRMTGSIRLRRRKRGKGTREKERERDDRATSTTTTASGNICGSTFLYDSSDKGTKKAEGRTDRLDMPLENLFARNFSQEKAPGQESPLFGNGV